MRLLANHHVLASPEARQNARFFVDVLGFEASESGDDGWCFVSKDGFLVMIGQCPEALDPGRLGDHAYFAYLLVDDVDEYYRQIIERGGQPGSRPADKPWGLREFGVQLPDGHRMMIGSENEDS